MLPPDQIFSPCAVFVSTYVAKLSNLHVPFEKLTEIISNNLGNNIVAINSNFGHAAVPEYKAQIKPPKKIDSTKGRTRKIQGDGSCFNSAIEPVIKIDSSSSNKLYYVKCFPTTGQTQIPGVIHSDFSDGHEVLVTFVNYLNNLKITDSTISILNEGPNMVNCKFELNRSSDRLLINLMKLSEYLQIIELNKYINDSESEEDNYSGEWHIIKPPFYIKEVKSPVDDIKASFKASVTDKRSPRINIFQEGKVNILGGLDIESCNLIYEFLNNIFRHNWKHLINIKPEKDKINN